ncbi:hypothetical protein C0214_19685 [Methylobacterium sp. DM1]|nr:hypothetical protein C0214_19685 [Methylobacterium sp. DM1]
MRDRARQGFDFFVSQGYSPAAAAGILGNFVQESRLNPGARNPGDGTDGSDSIGLGQWNSGRAQNLSRFSRANGLNPQDFETQLRFTDWELQNTHRGARDALMSAKNPTEAAAAFVTQFERPKGSNRGAEYAHGWGTRNAHANAIFGAYGQGVPARQEAPRQQAVGMVELLDDADAPAQNAQPVGFQIPEGLSQSDPRVTGQPQPGMVELLDDEPTTPRLQPSQAAPAPQGQRPRVRVSLPAVDEDPERTARVAQYEREARAGREQLGPVMSAVDTAVRGAARAVPFMDDIAAAGRYATGGADSYQDALDRERAINRVDDADRPVTSYGTQIGAGLALPGGALASSGVRGAAAVGAGYGALYGAGQGDGLTDRAERAVTGGAIGGALGAALPAAVSAAGRGASAVGNAVRGTPQAGRVAGQEVVEAADRLGVQLPRAVTTDNMSVQRGAAAVRNIPFAGNPLVRGAEQAIAGLGQAADNVAAGFGGGTQQAGGEAAGSAIRNWITGTSRDRVGRLYDAVDEVVDPNVRTPLMATQAAVADIAAKNSAAGLPPGKAAELVLDAVQRPEGLSYEGIKTLRTRIGELQKNGLLPADISGGELKAIYGALSQDLRDAVGAAGGQNALAAFERANRYNALVSQRREQLAKVVGVNGDAPAERVFDRLKAAASSSSRADVELLTKARRAIGGEDWNDLAGSVAASLGRDAEGQFSPQRFLTDYGKLSGAGKAVLFKTTGQGDLARALDDIATVSSRFKDLQKFANPSGTAQNLAGGGLVAGALSEPVTTLAAIVGGNVVSRVLAAPASASSAAKWAQAYERMVRRPAAATAAAYQTASRNLAATINADIGASVNVQDFLRALQGPVASRAEDEQR